MKATLHYKGYGVELSDEVDGTNQGSYRIVAAPDKDDEQVEATVVECQNWQNLEVVAKRVVDQLILSKP